MRPVVEIAYRVWLYNTNKKFKLEMDTHQIKSSGDCRGKCCWVMVDVCLHRRQCSLAMCAAAFCRPADSPTRTVFKPAIKLASISITVLPQPSVPTYHVLDPTQSRITTAVGSAVLLVIGSSTSTPALKVLASTALPLVAMPSHIHARRMALAQSSMHVSNESASLLMPHSLNSSVFVRSALETLRTEPLRPRTADISARHLQ